MKPGSSPHHLEIRKHCMNTVAFSYTCLPVDDENKKCPSLASCLLDRMKKKNNGKSKKKNVRSIFVKICFAT